MTYLLPRMVVEVPFIVFAVLLPFLALGPRTEFLGLTVSAPGLLAAWTLLAKATLGVLAGLTLAATTEPQEVVRGLERLRLPNTMVQIMAFMIRYLEVVGDDLRRQQIAPRFARVFRSQSAALACPRPLRGSAVHPLLRARRTGLSGDAVPRLHRPDAAYVTTPVLDVRGLAYVPGRPPGPFRREFARPRW